MMNYDDGSHIFLFRESTTEHLNILGLRLCPDQLNQTLEEGLGHQHFLKFPRGSRRAVSLENKWVMKCIVSVF